MRKSSLVGVVPMVLLEPHCKRIKDSHGWIARLQVRYKVYLKCLFSSQIKHVLFLQTAENDAGQTIVKIARENNANTLVMGSRGLGTVRRTLLGSVSDYVLHHAHIPTCVIPPTIEEAK